MRGPRNEPSCYRRSKASVSRSPRASFTTVERCVERWPSWSSFGLERSSADLLRAGGEGCSGRMVRRSGRSRSPSRIRRSGAQPAGFPHRRADAGSGRRRSAVVLRRRRRTSSAGLRGLPDPPCAPIRSLSGDPHITRRAATASDHGSLWRDATAPAAALLLADDPGAGKTIMAGLFIKELLIRGDLERCLIVAPGSLVEQWQDELSSKFGLSFDILTRDQVEAARTGNPFGERALLIARLDMLSRSDDLKR